MSVAYQGEPGAFGHEACVAFLPEHAATAKPSFAAVIAAVATGESDFGMLPVENSCAGKVEEVQALLDRCGLPIVVTHDMPVRMHLLAVHGASLEEVRTAISHPMALAQSARTLRAMGLATRPAANTAAAAKALAANGDRTVAVLASEAAAAIYGLTILRRDVHDRPDNATRFCVVAQRPS